MDKTRRALDTAKKNLPINHKFSNKLIRELGLTGFVLVYTLPSFVKHCKGVS